VAKVRAPSVGGLDIKAYRGKVVLLDFFTFGCVNCINNLQAIKALHVRYKNDIVIIGIHSAKFDREKDAQALCDFLKAYSVEYKVIADNEHILLDNYAIKAWPTNILIDESGYIVDTFSGESTLTLLREKIEKLTSLSEVTLNETSLDTKQLHYPQRLTCSGEYLIISNTSANAILFVDYDANVLHVIENIPYPLGSCVYNDNVYVTSLNSLIEIDTQTFKTKIVIDNLRSPSDVFVNENTLIVSSMASHKILFYDAKTFEYQGEVGNGFEALRDGNLDEAQLAQPMALEMFDNRLYFIDAETSSLRVMDALHVKSIIGEGLFTFGDSNEGELLLQHPQDLCIGKVFDGCGAGRIFIADTYNNKIKVYDDESKSMMTLMEELHAPSGIDKKGCKVYVADTNAHQILCFDVSEMKSRIFM